MNIKRSLILLVLMAPLLAASAYARLPATLPPAITALQKQGVHVVTTFDTGTSLTGYAATMGTRPVAIYVTPDGKHAIIGHMLDEHARPLHGATVRKLTVEPMSRHVWTQLARSEWAADGADDAPRVVYVFSDPNCPYCHRFWQRSRAWVKAGKVQLRHVMVGVISKTSPNKAAAILTATDREKAFNTNEHHFATGGITPLKTIPDAAAQQLRANRTLMTQLNIPGTPGVVYRDARGHVQIVRGVPQGAALKKVLGPLKK